MNYRELQQAENKRWRLLPKWKHLKVFDELIDSEFLASDIQIKRVNNLLVNMLRFSNQAVPFYRSLYVEREIDISAISGIDELHQLPILDRGTVQANSDSLKATQLPPNIRIGHATKTSGSTGQPVEVLHSANSLQFFSVLKQREYRCWGFDPSKRLAVIRPAVELPRIDGEQLQSEKSVTGIYWPSTGRFFMTGDSPMLPDISGTDFIVKWLNETKPDYLLCMSAVLERIALGYANWENTSGIQAALSISQQLTQGMRQFAEKNVTPNVQQNYGLNEIGLVAMRCPESGQYHVHNENCLIEVVDKNGLPCEPGVGGRLLVTGLLNYAMPLIRYDTDDLAEIVTEACPCGRSAQSFTNIRGRYRRTAHLPEGTWDYWDAILYVFGHASKQEMANIKQYQLHQLSANKFNLKLKVDAAVPESLIARIHERCKIAGKGKFLDLNILQLDQIEQPGKKFQNFISEIAPPEY